MRPRIKRRVNVQEVIDEIEHRIKVYSKCIKSIMDERNVNYNEAKLILNFKLNKNGLHQTN
jgi:hypothetical protein